MSDQCAHVGGNFQGADRAEHYFESVCAYSKEPGAHKPKATVEPQLAFEQASVELSSLLASRMPYAAKLHATRSDSEGGSGRGHAPWRYGAANDRYDQRKRSNLRDVHGATHSA